MIIFLISLTIFFLFFYTKKNFDISLISDISKLPNIYYSNGFFEPRIKEYKNPSTKFYLEQKELNYQDFIYAK